MRIRWECSGVDSKKLESNSIAYFRVFFGISAGFAKKKENIIKSDSTKICGWRAKKRAREKNWRKYSIFCCGTPIAHIAHTHKDQLI